MNEQELNKKLAEWRGLEDFQIFADHAGNYYKMQFIDPQRSQVYIVGDAFHLSLDACFKWLVPKLELVTISLYPDKWVAGKGATRWCCEIKSNSIKREFWTQRMAETPAPALCLAIEKLIEGEL